MNIRKRIFLMMIMSLSILQALTAFASEQTVFDREVIFVLDASGSMKSNDPNRLAIDSIAQLIYTLPSNYKAGFVAYNTEVVISQEPIGSLDRDLIMAQADMVKYADYTNAGAGLYQAVEMLSKTTAKERHIVLLSDGEILMADENATAQSMTAFQGAVSQAVENNIVIHVIGLGTEMENTENSIFAAALKTGGSSYYTPQAVGIQQAIDTILADQLHIKRIAAAIVDLDGSIEKLSIDLPFTYASKVRVLMTSSGTLRNLSANFQADNAKQINGERYSLIEIDRPKSSQLDLSFTGTAGDRVIVTLIPEYYVIPKVEVTSYEDIVPLTESATFYEREATITYTFYDAANENIQLWSEGFFNHSQFTLEMGEVTTESALDQGSIQIKEIVTDNKELRTKIDYSNFSANILGKNEVMVLLEGPPYLPVKEPEPEPPYLLMVIGVLLAGGVIVIIWGRKIKKQNLTLSMTAVTKAEGRPEPGKYSYVGKLDIYITRTKSGYDIPPLSYDLFRLPQSKVISLAEVLESCGVTEHFEGAEGIYIKSGSKRSIIVTNNSDCTIMKSREILMKKKSYPLLADAKVDITFEDEISELTLQYKDLRLSEMR